MVLQRPVFSRGAKLLVIVFCVFFPGYPLFAEPPDRSIDNEGAEQGRIDAAIDPSINPWGSFFIGCIPLPCIGLILPWTFGVSVPTDRMIGKSSEYVDAYAKAYVGKVKGSRFLWALLGTTTEYVIVGICIIAVAGPAVTAAQQGCNACMALPAQIQAIPNACLGLGGGMANQLNCWQY